MYTEVDDDVMLTRASHQSDMDVGRGSSGGGSFAQSATSPAYANHYCVRCMQSDGTHWILDLNSSSKGLQTRH